MVGDPLGSVSIPLKTASPGGGEGSSPLTSGARYRCDRAIGVRSHLGGSLTPGLLNGDTRTKDAQQARYSHVLPVHPNITATHSGGSMQCF